MTRIAFIISLLIGLPLLGVILVGKPLALYLEFPPVTRYVEHAPFSWPFFLGTAVFVIVARKNGQENGACSTYRVTGGNSK